MDGPVYTLRNWTRNHNNSNDDTLSTDSGNETPQSLRLTRLIVQHILVPIIVSGGVIGNVFNIIVLRNRKMRSSTNVYLTALAICDTLYLIFMFVLSFVNCGKENLSSVAFHFIPYGRMISDLFGNTAVWLTVAFTIERFVGVCYPMKGKAWCTVKKAKMVSLAVLIICLINTFPNLFEIEIVEKSRIVHNTSIFEYDCQPTKLARRDSFNIGYYWWYVAFFSLVPFAFLFFFNSMLIKSVWKANKRRHLLSNSTVIGENHRQAKEQQRVTTMLITVVLIFLVCQLPWTVLLLFRAAHDIVKPSVTILILGNICNLLVQINASVNFLLYSYFSSKFRCTFRKLFCRWRRKSLRKGKTPYSSNTFRTSLSNTTTTTTTSGSSCRTKRGMISDAYKHKPVPIEEP